MAMNSLSRKLQNFAVRVELILIFSHWVLLATVTGWPQLSVAPVRVSYPAKKCTVTTCSR
jgi:hypothetical protein